MMAFITWDEELSVNVPEIDTEHKHLIGLVNRLYEIIKEERSEQEFSDVYNEFIESVTNHFSHEERLMAQANYRGLASHKREHDFYNRKIVELQKRYLTGEHDMMDELSNFLKEWIFHHLRGIDRDYSSTLRQSLGLE